VELSVLAVDPNCRAVPCKILFAPFDTGIISPAANAEVAVTTFAARTPESVNVHVVVAVVQSTRSPVVGTVANPAIVFVVVAPLLKIVWALAALFAS
jgi:hypothetical protein